MIASEFEPAVSMIDLYRNVFVPRSAAVKKVWHFSDITGKRPLLRTHRLLSEWTVLRIKVIAASMDLRGPV